MHVDHTPTQKALRAELRAYFAKLIPPEVRAQIRSLDSSPLQRRLIRQMGADGWLGVGWPKEWGGQGRTGIEQQIWFEEARKAGAPLPFVTLNTVGPALIARGSEAQKRRFLPGDPARRDPFRDRLHRARRRHGSRFARDARRARGRRASWSTAPRSSPAAPTTPTTSGSPAAPIRRRISTRASRS